MESRPAPRSLPSTVSHELLAPIKRPTILFVCHRNSGRSQIAAGYLRTILGSSLEICTGGTEPASAIDPDVVAVMAEEGIDLTGITPRRIDVILLARAARIIAIGCDVTGLPRIDEDWLIDDPEGRPLHEVRAIRDQIKRLTLGLAGAIKRHELGIDATPLLDIDDRHSG